MAKTQLLTKTELLVDRVADETGATTAAIEKVLDLLVELEEHMAQILVKDGEAFIDWLDGFSSDDGEGPDVPEALQARLAAVEFDLVQLVNPIKRAWPAVYGHPYPLLAKFRLDQ
jgi:hypothetical protein